MASTIGDELDSRVPPKLLPEGSNVHFEARFFAVQLPSAAANPR